MPLVPIVAVEIPNAVAAELSTATLRACNLALGAGRCAVSVGSPGSQGNAWIAKISLDPGQPALFRIDLRNAAPQSTRTSFTRTLTFEGTEAQSHRWSTAGVVVAALVLSAESAAARDPDEVRRADAPGDGTPNDANGSTATSSEGPPNRDVAATTQTQSGKKPARQSAPVRAGNENSARTSTRGNTHPSPGVVRVDLGGLLGPSAENATLRKGVLLRSSLELGRSLFAWTSLNVAWSEQAMQAFWWSGAVGLGFATTDRDGTVGIEARLGARGDRLSFSATSGNDEDHALRLRAGALAGVDVSLSVSQRLALWVSGEGALMSPRIEARVLGKQVGQVGPLDGSVAMGIRVRFGNAAR